MKLGKTALLGAAAALLALAGWQWWSDARATANAQLGITQGSSLYGSTSPTPSAEKAANAGKDGAGSNAPFSTQGLQQRQAQQALWQRRYERAEQSFAAYKDATRYPPESRPLAEHPDQIRPFSPVSEQTQARDAQGQAVKFTLRTSQERVFLSGADTVKFSIEALDEKGTLLPVAVTSARAQSLAESRTLTTTIGANLDFADDGAGADEVAGDAKYTARLNPAQQGFAQYRGTIRLLATVKANGQEAVAHFDVVYTPGSPATWLGMREAFEAGSLNFYARANVLQAGRYVVSARVDDAHGKPFALLQYNEEVAAGVREFKLHVIGVLVRDKNPAFPLRVRDIEGFLLLPDQHPDRVLMPRLSGVVHTSAKYNVANFSSDEWQSDERQRYLDEYSKDVELARLQVQKLQTAQP